MVTERFPTAVWDYRRRGGKLYKLANDHDISPSQFSATLSGARNVGSDERVIAIGVFLGVPENQVFEGDDEAAAS